MANSPMSADFATLFRTAQANGLPVVLPSPWTGSRLKRAFDITCAVPMTLAALPLMALVALLVRVTSPGPVLFRQQRCGKDVRSFELLKFRSMYHGNAVAGPGVTRAGDPRLTPLGRALRKWKLDELPQLFNIVQGHMTLVGPRPELPEFLTQLTAPWFEVYRLRPGITGWATLRYRDEEQLLTSVPPDELRSFYVRVLMPEKARLDLEYGGRATFWSDCAVLLRTGKALFR
jgi:lipopolysaccharide/colanic/teichoic acid biosynthesis glycosyltransferase